LALHDALTGLYNRHYLDSAVARGIAHSARTSLPLSIVLLDIDHFKQVNDSIGHQGGDAVLRALGEFLLQNVRDEDFACRFGGEEFVVVLPGADIDDALARAEGWRDHFSHQGISCGETTVHVTLSGGVASFPNHGLDPDLLLQSADAALYAAKSAGRNQVFKAQPIKPTAPPTAPVPGAH
jgi:diguanylate cyclase (GGDEF)-like protein